MRKWKRRLVYLLLIITTGLSLYYYATSYAPNTLRVRNENIISSKIPSSLDNVKIGIISDINGDLILLENAINAARDNKVDTLIIMGTTLNTIQDEETIQKYIEILGSYEPKLGKYGIYSSDDYASDIETLNYIYNQSLIYPLANKAIEFHNMNEEYINIVGIDGLVNKDENPSIFYPSINNETYTITFLHDPSLNIVVNGALSDLNVSGKHLGGKLSIPFIGSINSEYEAIAPYETKDQQILINHQGLGLLDSKIRFNTQPELIILTLNHE